MWGLTSARFRVEGVGCRVWGVGSHVGKHAVPEEMYVEAPAFRVSGFGFRVSGFGFRVSRFALRVQGPGLRVEG